MSKTNYTTNSAETRKAWNEEILRDSIKDIFFSKFMGTSADSIVQVKSDLQKGKGDTVKFGLVAEATGNGVVNGTLEGNEESLSSYMDSVTLDHYRNAIRSDGVMTEQRAFYDVGSTMRDRIKTWARSKMEGVMATAISAPNKSVYGGTATTINGLTTSDKITPAVISKARRLATRNSGEIVPLREVRAMGMDALVLLISPEQAYDLSQDTTWAQAQREANVRGESNPILSGLLGIWDGVLVYPYNRVVTATNGSAVPYSKAILLGAQSLICAFGNANRISPNSPERFTIIERDFDYGNELGVSCSLMFGAKAPSFSGLATSSTYGSLGVVTAHTAIALA